MVKILNVAEKNDAAKTISRILSNGQSRTRTGVSLYNKVYEFNCLIFGRQNSMVMTSVSGHVLNYAFGGLYKKWESVNPVALFDAPVIKTCIQNYEPVQKNLEKEIIGCNTLIIWTDCDREGENIGFEIIKICKDVKPNIQIFRAKFSDMTNQSILRACQNLVQPDERMSNAVEVRQELDLRIGAAFTRFQTLRFKRLFPTVLANSLLSYGSCQFPTLGFVVERYKQIMDFVSEEFWKIRVSHKVEEDEVVFSWERGRLFDYTACLIYYNICVKNPVAKVVDVMSKHKSKWRPLPLDTVEMEKLASRKLRINAKETMTIAEKLYTNGLISYPRTETNIFPKDLNLMPLVEMQANDHQWGAFARLVLDYGPNPRAGKKSDQAHPPIHPTKYTDSLQGNEKRLYEFIVRHFLACVSKDAQGFETVIEIDIAEERFSAKGLMITERNYLEVYPYDKWSEKTIPIYQVGQTFTPSEIEMAEGHTDPPLLLTEADLIALMEKHGIGTDATHAEHIEKIKNREYVGLQNDDRFLPGRLGMGLVEGYDAMGFAMSKPNLRAELEADLKRICEGTKNPGDVLKEQIGKYRAVFVSVAEQVTKLDQAMQEHLGLQAEEITQNETTTEIHVPVKKCDKCGADMILRKIGDKNKFYVGCMNFPACRKAIWFPESVQSAVIMDEYCEQCDTQPIRKIKFTFNPRSIPAWMSAEYVGCIGGCDSDLDNLFGINDSFGSTSSSTVTPQANRTTLSAQNNNITFPSNRTTFTNRDMPMPSTSLSNMRGRSRPTTSTPRNEGDGDGQSDPNCDCGEPAIRLTVRKEGPNTGRQFYKCAKQPNNEPCKYFMFADQLSDDNRANNVNTSSFNNSVATLPSPFQSARSSVNHRRSSGGNASNNITCNCGLSAKRLTVQKTGPNTGRQFYCCSKPRDQGCNFFQWAEDDENMNEQRRQPEVPKRRGRGGGRSRASGQTHIRKCGSCGQEGHDKRNCPSR